MNNNSELEIGYDEDTSSKKVFITAITTGLIFWSSLFTFIFICLRS